MRSAHNSKWPVTVSCVLAFAVPVLLAAYWPMLGLKLDWAPTAIRAGVMLCAGLLGWLWFSAPATATERRWVKVLGGYLLLLLLPVVFAGDFLRAGKNWLRIFILLAFCLALARAFRHPLSRRAFGIGALLASLLLSLYILTCYLSFAGAVLPTYESTRVFKESVLETLGVGLNPLAFSAAFFCILAACVLRSSWVLHLTLALVILISTIFTGSRTPLVLMVASAGLAALVEMGTGKPLWRWTCLVGIVPALVGLSAWQVRDGIDLHYWSELTEGRIDLWSVAWDKFVEKPLTGYGADSWSDDLISRNPSLFAISNMLVKTHAGGYHNTYLTLLAEEGCVVFAFALYLLWRLFRTISESVRSDPQQRYHFRIYLISFLFLGLRGLVEVPGIFGYAEDPAEFAAYCFVALVISLGAVAQAPVRESKVRTPVSPRWLLPVGQAR